MSGLLLLLAAAIVALESPTGLSICDRKAAALDYRAWVDALHTCAPATVAAAKRPLPDDLAGAVKSKQTVAVRAKLVPGIAMCTLMDCDSSCCNGCSFEWVVVPRKDCPDWRLAIRRAGESSRVRGRGIDCDVHSFGARAAEVIVTGRLETSSDTFVSEVIVAKNICRVESGAGDGKRLSDADYARLMSPPPAEPEPRLCPRRPRQGQ